MQRRKDVEEAPDRMEMGDEEGDSKPMTYGDLAYGAVAMTGRGAHKCCKNCMCCIKYTCCTCGVMKTAWKGYKCAIAIKWAIFVATPILGIGAYIVRVVRTVSLHPSV